MLPFGAQRHALTLRQGVSYEAEAVALFARMSTPPTGPRKTLINTLVKSLKAASVWTRFDALYLLAAADSQAARLNWISSSFTLTAVSSPTFTTDRGYAGDGVGAYLDSGFNPATAGGRTTLNSAHMGWWVNTAISENAADMGNTNSVGNSRDASGNFVARVGSATTSSVAVGSPVGHSVVDRSASNVQTLYKNGSSVQIDPHVSTSLSSENYRLLTRAGSAIFNTRRIAAAHYGQSLSAADVSALYSALNTYLTAVGGN